MAETHNSSSLRYKYATAVRTCQKLNFYFSNPVVLEVAASSAGQSALMVIGRWLQVGLQQEVAQSHYEIYFAHQA